MLLLSNSSNNIEVLVTMNKRIKNNKITSTYYFEIYKYNIIKKKKYCIYLINY